MTMMMMNRFTLKTLVALTVLVILLNGDEPRSGCRKLLGNPSNKGKLSSFGSWVKRLFGFGKKQPIKAPTETKHDESEESKYCDPSIIHPLPQHNQYIHNVWGHSPVYDIVDTTPIPKETQEVIQSEETAEQFLSNHPYKARDDGPVDTTDYITKTRQEYHKKDEKSLIKMQKEQDKKIVDAKVKKVTEWIKEIFQTFDKYFREYDEQHKKALSKAIEAKDESEEFDLKGYKRPSWERFYEHLKSKWAKLDEHTPIEVEKGVELAHVNRLLSVMHCFDASDVMHMSTEPKDQDTLLRFCGEELFSLPNQVRKAIYEKTRLPKAIELPKATKLKP